MSFLKNDRQETLNTNRDWTGWKHGALRPQKPLRLITGGEVGGSGILYLNTYWLHCHHQTDSAFKWAAV